ncbi:MAG: aspartate kinase [Coriobacteriia bacterium]|nr:aspartate kinase [Coriobacteriia bacterium]
MTGTTSGIVVMKFGGTSVATADARAAVARAVLANLNSGGSPVLVVSAMGRAGQPYATDTLLSLVDALPTDARERDLLMASGEVVAAVVLAHELRAAGVDARAFTGGEAGIGTDGAHGSAAITDIHPGPLIAAISQGAVPVVTGFQGIAQDGSLTTLGRGGSDTTACALGVALQADAVEIYTDVDGVMSADPCTCDGPEVLEVIRADELHQMARHGARVIHTPAAELALASGLSVRVRNTYSNHPGTLVADIDAYRPDRVATAVSHTGGLARLRISLPAPEGTRAHMAAQARVYRAMADASVSLDMFTPVGETLVFSVADEALDRACEVLATLGLTYRVQASLSKVTLIGAGMHGVPGVMARMAEYLDRGGITVLQTADSHTTISVLVPSEECRGAVQALHDGFGLAASES